MAGLLKLRPSVFLVVMFSAITGGGNENCQSPQYAAIGTRQTIKCDFPEADYFGIFWYNYKDYSISRPIISLKSSQKEGRGFDSGEFDIDPDGSLIINNVTIENDHFFSVRVLRTTDEMPISINVLVVVTVKPTQSYPIIEQCGERQRICLTTADHPFQLSCYVYNARPAVHLSLVKRTTFGDEQLHFDKYFTEKKVFTSSSVNTTLTPTEEHMYAVFSCKETSFPPLLTFNESVLLVQMNDFDNVHFLANAVPTFVRCDNELSLICTNSSSILYITWKKVGNEELVILEPLIDTLYAEKRYDIIHNDRFFKRNESVLVLNNVQQSDEGIYVCYYGNGIEEHVKTFTVSVYVLPNPAFPMVDGCNAEKYCVLSVSKEGELTCTLKGIRPRVELKWTVFRASESSAINFTNHQHFVESNEGGTFDITLKTRFVIIGFQRRVTVECSSTNNGLETFSHLKTRLDLLLEEGTDKGITFENRVEHGILVTKNIWEFMIILIMVFSAVFVIFAGKRIFVHLRQQRKQRGSNGRTEEEIPLTQSQFQEEKDKLRDHLKSYYKKSHKKAQPIPYQTNKWYSITDCFVDTGIEYMRRGLQGSETWEKEEGYHEILKAEHSSTKRAIIEGEPGYGKSTLCVQLTKDWCDANPLSPLANVDILILIRSRRLNGNVKTFYDAIKKLFLPPDSKLSENVLRAILENYRVIVLLDGFDSYPGGSNLAYVQVEEIMNCNLLQNCLVILTTRSSCVRREDSTEAERYRLLGFDRNARSEYIKKTITHSLHEANEIEKIITTHPFLADLCQVPLLFVLFSHMVNRHGFGTGSQIQSVTTIFQNIMKCIYHHMQYENEGNAFENASFEYSHTKLDKLAFEGLKAGQISWERGQMHRYLGQTDYDRYCSSGILVEDESAMGTLQTITKVRFFHKLFCEWYASHHLSEIASQGSYEELKIQLQGIDPTDLQYVYRIACGLSEKAAAMIMQYVRNVRDGQQFEILCILEQPGKEDRFTETVTSLCTGRVNIDYHDSRLLQRSTVQLLTIAANNKIDIKDLWLTNMNCVADLSKRSLKIRQDLYLPSLNTLQQLTIVDQDRQISSKDFEDILEYSSLCNSLQVVRIEKCLLPRVMEKRRIPYLESKHKQVLWLLPHSLNTWYKLNITHGTWQHEERILSETVYANVKQDFDRLRDIT